MFFLINESVLSYCGYGTTSPNPNLIFIGDEGKSTYARFVGKGTTVDTCYLVYGNNCIENMMLARNEISDHLPVFAELLVS